MKRLTESISTNEYTLKNINSFIDHEGLKKTRLAKRMGMSNANFYDYLNNKRKGILDFSSELAETLGYDSTFFINKEFKLPHNDEGIRSVSFSAGEKLSPEGQSGFDQLLKICDLIEIYNLED